MKSKGGIFQEVDCNFTSSFTSKIINEKPSTKINLNTNCSLEILLLNVQCLTQDKIIEIE